MAAVFRISGSATVKMIAVMDQMKETFVLKKLALTSNSLVHERVIVFHRAGCAMEMTIVMINRMKR
jgi:hypothetical protein